MGAILKGRDLDLGRDLAIKILLDGRRDRPELVRRFIEEAQVGGQLQHPGIVPVHELGMLEDERPYFTMKLVRGRTLTDLLAARANLGDERPRFLAIFEQVCQTIAYAHSRGVVHRDLKPSNVMVGSFGEVQVMDWGLAKVLKSVTADGSSPMQQGGEEGVQTVRDDSGVDISRVGSVLGTPAYMAAEQARGETDRVDERADVFGLGAILCEILTGRPPYVGSTSDEVHRLAVAADLADAHRQLLACGAENELVSLARRCLAPLPSDRPRDGSEVAADITAYLRGVQERLKQAELASVEAQARSAQEKTRRRLAVGLAATTVALMATLGGGWTWWQTDRHRRIARVDLAVRDVELLTTEAETAGDNTAGWVRARDAARRTAQVLDDARDVVVHAKVATIVKYVEERAAQAEADAQLLLHLAEIGDRLGEDPPSQNDAAYALAFRDAGLDVAGGATEEVRLAVVRRPPRVVAAIVAALDQWAAVRLEVGDRDGAARITAVAREADPDEWRGRLRTALMDSGKATQLKALRELARSAVTSDLPAATAALLGAALERAGDFQSAELVLRPAQRRSPSDLWLALYLGRALMGLSRDSEGIRYYLVGHAIRPQTAHTLAHALKHLGETDEAIAVFREAVRTSPTNATNYCCLGTLLKEVGLAHEADELLDTSIAVARERMLLRPNEPFAHYILGTILSNRGRLEEAVSEYREVIRLLPSSSSAFVHRRLGPIRCRQGHVDDEFSELREAIRLEPHNPEFHRVLAKTLVRHGRLAEAIAALQMSIRSVPDVADLHLWLAEYLERYDRVGEAIDEYQQAIRLALDDASAHYCLARILRKWGRTDQVIAECREAIRLAPDHAEAHDLLAAQLKRRGQYSEALRASERCHELGSKRRDWTYPSGQWVEQARRLVQLEPRSGPLLRGEALPADATEYLDLAVIARNKGMYATAVALWTKAFAIDRNLAIDSTFNSRYTAAAAAAMAGCGKGTEEPAPAEPARAKLRRQALDWLKADLALYLDEASRSLSDMHLTERTLLLWKADIDLAGVRDQDRLALLPEAERTEWQELWLKVDRLLSQLRAHSHWH
jgi:serine/threonine-protein kinase